MPSRLDGLFIAGTPLRLHQPMAGGGRVPLGRSERDSKDGGTVMVNAFAGPNGAIVVLAMAFVFQFVAYVRSNARFLAFPLAAGFAFGAMALTNRAGVDELPYLFVAGLMAANFVLLIAFLIPRDRV
jgi:hypothetical protein